MPKPTYPNHSTWVIASSEQGCTNTICGKIIPAGTVCVKHNDSFGYACQTCGAKHFADSDDMERDLIAGGFKSADPLKPRIITSFGYKISTPEPIAGTIVVDIRKTVRNPWPIKALRALDGRSSEIKDFISKCPASMKALARLILDLQLGRNISIGCHGGKHRSVAIAEMLAAKAEGAGIVVEVVHRDLKAVVI